ncbi:hypothetical protein ACFQJ5_02385 [Halomicroarcula sp. GCM10025324]|jgi:hypothetical protein|uniref:hypothetical protein n=1 Tax=Haloarcula TaxID=2237 RepID=UPI0023E881DD|nr:hypothetical protein [Halomicroarcula sp. ZS-22-S1]
MTSHPLTGTVPDRLRWVLGEAAVLAGIFGFWLVLALAVTVLLSALTVLLRIFGIEQLQLVYELLARVEFLWPLVVGLTFVTAALYTAARVGTLLIARYRREGT